MSAQDTGSQEPSDIDSLQADIEATREELGQTVDALAAKLDVKARTRARLESGRDTAVASLSTARDRATDDDGNVRREVLVAAGVLALSVTAVVVLTIRKRRG